MEKVKLNVERCKGCYLCIENCKIGAITMSSYTNRNGVVTIQVDQNKCVQCGNCYTMCPDLVFEIL
ncbi:MAG TPA: 4Fe-4S binding protein [Mogibacterium sp.]|nr:4Fe-4S binding protein [Mogibacterium sp.]